MLLRKIPPDLATWRDLFGSEDRIRTGELEIYETSAYCRLRHFALIKWAFCFTSEAQLMLAKIVMP